MTSKSGETSHQLNLKVQSRYGTALEYHETTVFSDYICTYVLPLFYRQSASQPAALNNDAHPAFDLLIHVYTVHHHISAIPSAAKALPKYFTAPLRLNGA